MTPNQALHSDVFICNQLCSWHVSNVLVFFKGGTTTLPLFDYFLYVKIEYTATTFKLGLNFFLCQTCQCNKVLHTVEIWVFPVIWPFLTWTLGEASPAVVHCSWTKHRNKWAEEERALRIHSAHIGAQQRWMWLLSNNLILLIHNVDLTINCLIVFAFIGKTTKTKGFTSCDDLLFWVFSWAVSLCGSLWGWGVSLFGSWLVNFC